MGVAAMALARSISTLPALNGWIHRIDQYGQSEAMWDVPDSLCRQPHLLSRLLLELQFGVAADPVVDLPLDARLDFTPG